MRQLTIYIPDNFTKEQEEFILKSAANQIEAEIINNRKMRTKTIYITGAIIIIIIIILLYAHWFLSGGSIGNGIAAL